ncbi:MAG: hypothetical protein BBJ60_03755 [Desulfobacterales bacterium S7086C20]|nr:MAG: hypothetical protein BBJ60_03755 [Desulfobacterales bacterium S7086C20]
MVEKGSAFQVICLRGIFEHSLAQKLKENQLSCRFKNYCCLRANDCFIWEMTKGVAENSYICAQ